MSIDGVEDVGFEPDGRLASFFRFPGIRHERYQSGTNHIPVMIDVLLAAMLAMLLYINVVISPHPMAWFVGALAAIHVGLLVIKPRELERLRILGLAIACLCIAILQPLRTQEHAMAFSYIAMFGVVAFFIVRGTLPALSATVGYCAYAAYLQWLDPARTLVDALSSMAGMMASCSVLLVLLHHFLVKLEFSNRALSVSRDALQTSLDDLQYAATAGNLGMYECNLLTGRWQINSVMRRALELPEQSHPEVTTRDIVDRSDDEIHALSFDAGLPQASQTDYLDFEMHQFRLPSGRLLNAKINSRFSAREDGTPIRHGIVIFDPSMAI